MLAAVRLVFPTLTAGGVTNLLKPAERDRVIRLNGVGKDLCQVDVVVVECSDNVGTGQVAVVVVVIAYNNGQVEPLRTTGKTTQNFKKILDCFPLLIQRDNEDRTSPCNTS